jgi:hypothetical protein
MHGVALSTLVAATIRMRHLALVSVGPGEHIDDPVNAPSPGAVTSPSRRTP